MVKSDSLGALGALHKHASKSTNVSSIVREIALEMSQLVYSITQLTHIPGISNTLADPLSWLYMPNAKSLPRDVATLHRRSG